MHATPVHSIFATQLKWKAQCFLTWKSKFAPLLYNMYSSSIKVICSSVWLCCIGSLLPESCNSLELQVRMKFGVATEVSTFLVITQVSSGLIKSHILIFIKYKYLHVKIASLVNVKSCVTVGPIQPLPWEIGSIGCRLHWFGLYLPSKQSHYCGSQTKAEIMQESVSPVQQFDAETWLIPIMITKGPQLISKTNIPLLIPGWWRLCTGIKTAYACGCGNECVHI